MADGTLQYQNPAVVDELLDTEVLTVGVNSVHRERVQITGTGATQIAPVSATDGLLVNLGANNDVTVTSGSITANAGTNLNTSALALEAGGNLAAAAASLSVLDDWDETNRAAVNPISGQVGIQGGAGTVTALTTRVAIATDANAISGTVTANAGTNLNTSLLALEAGGNLAAAAASLAIMDDWDETDRAKVNPIVGQAGVQGASGTVTALTQRVVLATDVALPTGTNSIGQVTANAGTNLNTSALNLEATQTSVLTSLQIMDDWDESDRAKVNPIAGQIGVAAGSGTIDALTQRSVFGATTSSLSDGTANPNVQALAALSMTFDGSGWNRVSPTKPVPTYDIPPALWSYHESSSSALTDQAVKAAPGAGLAIYVTDIICSTGAATAMNVFFEEGASTVLGPYYLEAVAGRGVAVSFKTPKKLTSNTALTVTTSAAIAHGLDVLGFVAPG